MSSIEEPAANNVTTANTGVTQSLSDTSITIMSSSEETPPPSAIEEIPSPSPSTITSSIEVPREVSQSLTSISRKRKADGRLEGYYLLSVYLNTGTYSCQVALFK